jgi:hypothetical protein
MKNTDLWKKICEFKLDDPDAEVKFSDKLGKEENWSQPFTVQAISEYKKFIYLCIVLPNGASPSEIVDKVWHLHLTYTDNYWNQFCKKTLGKDIHHFPSKGGKQENLRHIDWYNDTLKNYVLEFGEIPPVSIWTIPKSFSFEQYLSASSPFRNPVYDEIATLFQFTSMKRALSVCGVAFLMLLFVTGNPYEMSGQAFLSFYAVLMLIGFALSFIKKAYNGLVADNLATQLHPIHFSLVFKDVETTMRMMIVNFVEKKYLSYENKLFIHVFDKGEALFYSIQAYENEVIDIRSIRKILFSQIEYFRSLVLPMKEKIRLNESIFWMFHGIIVLINIIRIIQGLQNNKPVGFLIVFLIAYPLIAYFISTFNVGNKSEIQETMEEKSTGFDFTTVAATFMFTEFYLLNGNDGFGTAFSPYDRERKWNDTTSASCGSSCSSDGGSGGGDGCGGGGCGGCGGGGD